MPSVAQMAKAFKPDQTQQELDAYYSEDNLRKILY